MAARNFKDVRQEALKSWRNRTDRTPEDDGASAFVDAFECRWQINHAGEDHNNFFCSLGEFATNIDDLLEDERFDEIEEFWVNDENSGKLYRYYCRILLVSEQIIEDFEKALRIKNSERKSWPPAKLKTFVNLVIKHRSEGKFHFNQLNDHLPIFFEVIPEDVDDQFLLNFENFASEDYDTSQIGGILMPRLISIIDVLIMCYQRLDERLKDANFRDQFNNTYCQKFDGT